MKKFSELKGGNYIYKLILNDNINYNGNFSEFIDHELNIKVEKIKIHSVIYPGIKLTGPYYYIAKYGTKASWGEKESNEYVNILYSKNNSLKKLILKNEEFSHDNNFDSHLDGGVFFTSKKALDKYVFNYCMEYIHQYECQIKSIEEKKEKYQKFINEYRSK